MHRYFGSINRVRSTTIAPVVLVLVSLFLLANPGKVNAQACGFTIQNKSISNNRLNPQESKISFTVITAPHLPLTGVKVEATEDNGWESNPITPLGATITKINETTWNVEIPNTPANSAAFQYSAPTGSFFESTTFKKIYLDYTNTAQDIARNCDLFAYDVDSNAPIITPIADEEEPIPDDASPNQCGDTSTAPISCGCIAYSGNPVSTIRMTNGLYCCGWVDSSTASGCSATPVQPPPPADTGGGGSGGAPADPPTGGGGGSTGDSATTPTLDIFSGPTSADFKALNPFEMYDSPYKNRFNSPAGIINRALLFAFPLAGLLLFIMIVWGGFEMVSGATNTKSLQAGRQRITAALIGFGLLFTSYWIIQIVEYIFNLAIL